MVYRRMVIITSEITYLSLDYSLSTRRGVTVVSHFSQSDVTPRFLHDGIQVQADIDKGSKSPVPVQEY